MDDDTAPRQAPPPKPSIVPQYGTPKPVVPEVSLMFDSEDSLIWQKPKAGTPISLLHRKDFPLSKPGYPSTNAKSHTPPPIIKNQISEKTYNPMVYSPSQKNNTNKEIGHSLKGIPPSVTRNVVPISRILTQTQNTVTSPPYANSNVTRKNLVPDPAIKSVHFHNTPEVPDEGTPEHLTRMQQHQKNLLAYRSEKENTRPQSPVVNEFRNTAVPNFVPQFRKEFHTATSARCNPEEPPHYPLNGMRVTPHLEHVSNLQREKSNNQVDLNIYHLMEKQNEHIFKLQTSLEKLLEKQQHDEAQRNREAREMKEIIVALNANQPVNQKQIFKDTCAQTEDKKPETCSVGTNTEVSWSDLVASSLQETLRPDDHEKKISDSREHVKIASMTTDKQEVPTEIHKNNFKVKQLNKRDIPLRQATNWTVHKEMSLTMQEVVMKTIEEDPPSPDPSVHISMTEYQDGSKHEEGYGSTRNKRKSTDWEGSPVLGESASTCSPTHDSPQRHEEAKPKGPTGVTFYNNVMTNIQHILQNSKSAEEEDGKRQDTPSLQRYPRADETGIETENSVPDPQMEAVRKQLMQFGISFIDPATLATNNRPVMDTMYLPGLHNMLSMYQNTLPSSTVSPYQETDATAAKYLTDAQLAAIAAASPAMRGRTRAIRETESAGPSHQQKIKNTATENNYSIATKKFLGKYGLHEN